jgi:hypothetical protein
MTPITKAGRPHGQSYVVCLDCGKQFEYDLSQMRVGKAIDQSHDACIVPPKVPATRETKIKYALLAAVPAAVVLGAVLTGNKKAPEPERGKADPEAARDEPGQGEQVTERPDPVLPQDARTTPEETPANPDPAAPSRPPSAK